LSVGSKILARIVAKRVQKRSERFLEDNQSGFRRGRGVDYAWQVTRRITEEVAMAREGSKTLRLVFLAIEKSYPRVRRVALWHAMRRKRVLDELIKVCKVFRDHYRMSAKMHGVLSSEYGCGRGCERDARLYRHYSACTTTACWRVSKKGETSMQPNVASNLE